MKINFENSLTFDNNHVGGRWRWVRLGRRFKVNCPLVGPGPIVVAPSVGVFLRDPSPYLHEFRRKPQKTLNGCVDKRDRGMNLASLVYKV